MAKRTMTVMAMWARTKRARGEGHEADVGNLPGGGDLLEIWAHHLSGLQGAPDELRDEKKQQYLYLDDVEVDGRTILVKGGHGTFGETRRRNFDVDSHQELYVNQDPRAERDAALIDLRAMIFVPTSGTRAIMFLERSHRHTIGMGLAAHFASTWPSLHSGLTFKKEPVLEAAAWLEGAELTKVQAKIYGWSSDSSDEGTKVVGTLTQTILPEGPGKVLPHALYEKLTEGRVSRASLLSMKEEPDEVSVTLENAGRSKTFVVEQGGLPSVMYLLSEDGRASPSDEAFKTVCQDYARDDIFPGVGGEWHNGWNSNPVGGGGADHG